MLNPCTRLDGVVSEEIDGQLVVYDSVTKRVHHLNATLSWIWKHCDGSQSIEQLSASIRTDLDVDDAHAVVVSGLSQLSAANLLKPGSATVDVNLLTRTPVTRRAAVAAGAALVAPAMTTILAPTPAAAKSAPTKQDTNEKKNQDTGKNKGKSK